MCWVARVAVATGQQDGAARGWQQSHSSSAPAPPPHPQATDRPKGQGHALAPPHPAAPVRSPVHPCRPFCFGRYGVRCVRQDDSRCRASRLLRGHPALAPPLCLRLPLRLATPSSREPPPPPTTAAAAPTHLRYVRRRGPKRPGEHERTHSRLELLVPRVVHIPPRLDRLRGREAGAQGRRGEARDEGERWTRGCGVGNRCRRRGIDEETTTRNVWRRAVCAQCAGTIDSVRGQPTSPPSLLQASAAACCLALRIWSR